MSSTVLRSDKVRAEKLEGQTTTFEQAFKSSPVCNPGKDKPKKIAQMSHNPNEKVYPVEAGLLGIATTAYNRHHPLVLRPDDVWQAIMVQFSLYVNAHAEELRSKLVTHDGKKKLTVYGNGTLHNAPYGMLAQALVEAMKPYMTDASVASWLLPNFSTTSDNDRATAAMTAMATMQTYFEYKMCLECGLPSVELLGTVEDWVELAARVEELEKYNVGKSNQMTKWVLLLRPVLKEFIATKEGVNNMDFWQKICHYVGGGSGPRYWSGWITVFSVFDLSGAWVAQSRSEHEWPLVDTDDVHCGVVKCPVVVDDNGTIYKCTAYAGHFAFSSPDGSTIVPKMGWCMSVDEEQ